MRKTFNERGPNPVVQKAIDAINREQEEIYESLRPIAPKTSILIDHSTKALKLQDRYEFEKFIFEKLSAQNVHLKRGDTLDNLAPKVLQREIRVLLQMLRNIGKKGRTSAFHSLAAIALSATEMLQEFTSLNSRKLQIFARDQFRWPILFSPHSAFSFQSAFLQKGDPFREAFNDLTEKLQLGRNNFRVKCSTRYRQDELMKQIFLVCDLIQELRQIGPNRLEGMRMLRHGSIYGDSKSAMQKWQLEAAKLPPFSEKPRSFEKWSQVITSYFELEPELIAGLAVPPSKRGKRSGVGYRSAIRGKVEEKIKSLFGLNKA